MLVESRRTENAYHPMVVWEDVGHEPSDPASNRSRGEMLEQHGTQAPSLVVIPHDERDLGLPHSVLAGPLGRTCCGAAEGVPDRRGRAIVASHRHQFPVYDGHEGQPFLIVDGYEVRDLLMADPPTRREETEIHRLSRQPTPERAKRRAVVRPNRSQPSRATVREQDVTFELGRIGPLRDRPSTRAHPARSSHLSGQRASRTG